MLPTAATISPSGSNTFAVSALSCALQLQGVCVSIRLPLRRSYRRKEIFAYLLIDFFSL